MVEPINSEEKVAAPTVAQGESPKHTQEEHRYCAYYPVTAGFEASPGNFLFVGMRCPHEVESTGAFYNEDYIRELKLVAQAVIRELEFGRRPALWKNKYERLAKLVSR